MREGIRSKQSRFARMVAQLINHATVMGYEVTLGEAYRPYASHSGQSMTLHENRLAIKLNLFIDGHIRSLTQDHEPLGLYWESIGGTWGGRLKDEEGNPKPEANHYSLAHNGMK